MNRKNFKSEYDSYMKNIKPSADLIQKTVKLANEEQERLRKSKETSSLKILFSLNFRKFATLARTLVLAIFADKLWKNINKQPISTDDNLMTENTTTENHNSLKFRRFTALACTLVFAIFAVKLWKDIDKQSIPVDPNPMTETTTENYMESDTTTVSTSVQSNFGTWDDTITFDSLNSSIYVTSNDDSISSGTHSNGTSTVYNNENTYTTTSVPYDNVTSSMDTSNNNDSTSSDVTQNNSIGRHTDNIAFSSVTESNVTTTNSITITTTTNIIDDVITSTSPDTEFGNEGVFITTMSTTTKAQANATTSYDTNMGMSTNPEYTNTTQYSSINLETTTAVMETTSIHMDSTTQKEDFVGEPSIDIDLPVVETTTYLETITLETTTFDDNITSPNEFATRQYMAIRVTLINKQDGFYEDGTIYRDRIMNYLTYGSELTCVIPLGKTVNQDCDCILVFDYQNMEEKYSTYYYDIANDLNNYNYSKIEIVETPDESNRDEYIQFEILNENLDLNENNINIESDIEDRNLFLDLLTIDDASLS